MNTRLQQVIERAYEEFALYRVQVPLDVCTVCCITEEVEAQLVRLNVRSIPQESNVRLAISPRNQTAQT